MGAVVGVALFFIYWLLSQQSLKALIYYEMVPIRYDVYVVVGL